MLSSPGWFCLATSDEWAFVLGQIIMISGRHLGHLAQHNLCSVSMTAFAGTGGADHDSACHVLGQI